MRRLLRPTIVTKHNLTSGAPGTVIDRFAIFFLAFISIIHWLWLHWYRIWIHDEDLINVFR